MMPSKNDFVETAKTALKLTSPLTWLVLDTAEKMIEKSKSVTDDGNMDDMQQEAARQEIS